MGFLCELSDFARNEFVVYKKSTQGRAESAIKTKIRDCELVFGFCFRQAVGAIALFPASVFL